MTDRRPFAIAIAIAVTAVPAILVPVAQYLEEQRRHERMFGTPEQQAAATSKIISEGDEAQRAGAAFALETDEKGCVAEGLARAKGDLGGYAELYHFLQGCLPATKPTDSFCSDVPPFSEMHDGAAPDDLARSRAFRANLCAEAGVPTRDCEMSLKGIQLHCQRADRPAP